MSDGPVMIDTPDGIRFAQMLARRGALKLEILGMRRRGRSAYSIIKQEYGYRGTRQSVLNQLSDAIDHIKEARNGVQGSSGSEDQQQQAAEGMGGEAQHRPEEAGSSPAANPHHAAADIHGGEE